MVVTSVACNGRLIGMSAGDDSGLLGEGTDAGQGYNRVVILNLMYGAGVLVADAYRVFDDLPVVNRSLS